MVQVNRTDLAKMVAESKDDQRPKWNNSVIAEFEDSATIHGKVIDQDNRQPIIGAVVTLDGNNQTLFESVTKKNGKFQFTGLKTEVKNLTVTHIGYEDYQQRIDLKTIVKQSLEIALVSNLIQLSPIVIIGQAPGINKKTGWYSHQNQYENS